MQQTPPAYVKQASGGAVMENKIDLKVAKTTKRKIYIRKWKVNTEGGCKSQHRLPPKILMQDNMVVLGLGEHTAKKQLSHFQLVTYE